MRNFAVFLITLTALTFHQPTPGSAELVTDGSFESGFGAWEIESGSASYVSIEDNGFGVLPEDGDQQALLRNGFESAGTGASDLGNIESFLGLNSGHLSTFASGTDSGGAAIRQTITVNEGDTLSFDWSFLTNEPASGGSDDFAFWSLSPAGTLSDEGFVLAKPADVSETSPAVDFTQQTGYAPFDSTSLTAGNYVLGFGVVNFEDAFVTSALLVDNVQLTAAPPTAVPEPGSLALLGLGTVGLAWRRRRRKQAKDVALPTAEA